MTEEERRARIMKDMSTVIHDYTVVMQAAYIEWKRGKGADAAMQWIENTLWGPGHIPSPDEPWGKEAQAYYDANRSDPFPTCPCGRPSNQLANGRGYCSEACYKKGAWQ